MQSNLCQYLTPKSIKHKIRIGNNTDGGYIVALDHFTSHRLISCGCDDRTSFETGFLLYNPSSEIIIFDINNLCDLKNLPNVLFKQQFINNVSQLPIQENCILKIDIEGSEYDMFLSYISDASQTLEQCVKQLIVEFHFDIGQEQSWIQIFKYLQEHFYLVHIHANTCAPMTKYNPVPDVIECTYINKKQFTKTLDTENVPYPVPNLDYRNCISANNYILNWWI